MKSSEKQLPNADELKRLSLRAVIALAARAARLRPLSSPGEAALKLAEDFVQGGTIPRESALQAAKEAEAVGEVIAAAAARAAVQYSVLILV